MTTINVPVNLGASLDEDGITIHAWVDSSEDQAAFPITFTRLVDELIEGYTIPNHRDKLTFNVEDFNYLKSVANQLRIVGNYFSKRLDSAMLI